MKVFQSTGVFPQREEQGKDDGMNVQDVVPGPISNHKLDNQWATQTPCLCTLGIHILYSKRAGRIVLKQQLHDKGFNGNMSIVNER